MPSTLRPDLPPIPRRMAHLPIDPVRGVPVPWFVSWVDGKPEFRAADARKFVMAVRNSACWVCGTPVGPHYTFVIGPMCAVNRNTAEPPCHADCAEFSARACPFLTRPAMERREEGLPDGVRDPAGHFIKRNPGVACLWTSHYALRPMPGGGVLFTLMRPSKVRWFAEGREATRAEVLAAVESGLPILRAEAERGGPDDVAALAAAMADASEFWPAA